MNRTITSFLVLFLTTTPLVYAEDSSDPVHGIGLESYQWGFKGPQLQGIDLNTPLPEYEAVARHNRKVVSHSIRTFARDSLELIGIPEQGVNIIGTAVGLATSGAKLNLNRSNTLKLEVRDLNDSARTLYLGVSMDW